MRDIKGLRVGQLTVISFSHIAEDGHAVWKCACDCGRDKKVKSPYLVRGGTKSCGCIINKNKIKKWSPIALNEQTVKIPLTRNKFAAIDAIDIAKISGYSWYCDPTGYARDRNGVLMHRIVMDCPEDKEIDHKDHNKLNNVKSNLRVCNRAQNQWNKLLTNKNTSGFKGASYSRDKGKYSSCISCNKKQYHLGYFENPEEAHVQYVNKGKELFGEFFNNGEQT